MNSPEEDTEERPIIATQMELPEPSESTIKASKNLPREEAEYKLKRIGNKILYEIDLPGIKSLDHVLISKLEDSTEIRAFTKKKVLHRTLQVNLPLISYYLRQHTLVLEFEGR